MNTSLSFGVLLLCLVCLGDCMNRIRNKTCYDAKICIHNAHEKCGVDGKGNLRRFYDSCDIMEYNCLKGTDYAKTAIRKCDHLPPIDAEGDNRIKGSANQEHRDNMDGTSNLEEPGIKGEVTMDNDEVKGEITLDDQAEDGLINEDAVVSGDLEVPNQEEHESTDETTHVEEPGIKGEVTMDNDEVKGEITLDDKVEEGLINQDAAVEEELEAPNPEGNEETDKLTHLEEPGINGEVTMDNDEVKGEITLDDEVEEGLINQDAPVGEELEAPNQEEYDTTDRASNRKKPGIKGEVTIDNDEVKGDITLNDEAEDLVNQENAAVRGQLEAPNQEDSSIKDDVTMNNDEIKEDITLDGEAEEEFSAMAPIQELKHKRRH